MHTNDHGGSGKKIADVWRAKLAIGQNQNYRRYYQKSQSGNTGAEGLLSKDAGVNGRHQNRHVNFSDFAEQFTLRRMACGRFKESTLKSEQRAINRINGYIGSVPLAKIDSYLISRLQAQMVMDGYTPVIVYRTLKKLGQILKEAMAFGLLDKSPCEQLNVPKPKRRAISSLSAEEALELLTELERRYTIALEKSSTSPHRSLLELSRLCACRIALSTGMRRGEILGLSWRNVDLKNGSIRITRQYTAEGKFSEPKTRSGIRTISLDSQTRDFLQKWKLDQNEILESAGIGKKHDLPVVCNSVGNYSNASDLNAWWKKLRTEIGFESLHLHDLRHTQATLLIGNGIDIKTVQGRLGHSRAATTLDTYACALPENDRIAANLLDIILSHE